MPQERRLAAILSADVVGYSRLMTEDEQGTIQTLTAYRSLISSLVADHHGRVVDSPGDNLLTEFPNALDAVQCAVEIQGVLRVRNQSLAENRQMLFRIGVHLGDITAEGDRIYGDGVNIAARLEGLAKPGGICISGTVYDVAHSRLDLGLDDLGEQEVKNIPDPVRVYRVSIEAGAPATAPRRVRRAALVMGLAAVVGAAAVAAWQFFGAFEPTTVPSSAPIRSIAVLPMENLSGDPEQEYFADGMTEALIGDLAKIGSLRVISRTSVMQYKDVRKPLREIAQELDVDAVIEGTVMRAEDRVRITVQLIHARSDTHLWNERYDRELSDVLALQSDVARAVAKQIRVELTPEDQARLAGTRRVDPEAHEAYLRGLHHLWTQFDPRSFPLAAAAFKRSIELDPNYAPAHSGLSTARWYLHAFGVAPAREMIPLQREAALKALELDENLPEAHLALGLSMYGESDFQGAEHQYRRAIELNPNDSRSAFRLGLMLTMLGQIDEAEPYFRRARELDPLDLNANVLLGWHAHLSGDSELALEQLSQTVGLYPDRLLPRIFLFWIYLDLERETEAVAQVREIETMSPRPSPRVAAYRALVGETAEAEVELREAIALSGERYIDPINVAEAWAALGETERAFEWLERAYEKRSWTPAIRWSAAFDPMRSNPRFQDLLRRIGFPEG